MNELTSLQHMRAEIPAPTEQEMEVGEQRLRQALSARVSARTSPVSRGDQLWRRPVVLWPGVAAAFVSTAAVVAIMASGEAARTPKMPEGPPMVAVAVAQVLDRAASSAQSTPELNPRDDQFIVYKSIAMDSMTLHGSDEQRYLPRTERLLWASVDGKHDGALLRRFLQPKAYPGWPLPSRAIREAGTERLFPVPACDAAGTPTEFRSDYPYLKTLPTDADEMLTAIKRRTGDAEPTDLQTWRALTGLLSESYLPLAQRAALFRAAKQISGVTLLDTAKDAADRPGIAISRVDEEEGARIELIFDPATYQYRGQSSYVVDASKAKAPAGSQISARAEISVSVIDRVPEIPPGEIDANGTLVPNSNSCK